MKRKMPKTTTNYYESYFTIYTHIKEHGSIKDLPEKTGISLKNLYYYISHLKRASLINSVGYGTWEVAKTFDYKALKQVKTTTKIKHQGYPRPSLGETIRGHAFQFRLKIPKLKNWHKREQFLNKKNIKFKPLKIQGGGQSLFLNGNNIQITNKSIVIHEKSSFLADSAKDSKSYAIYSMMAIISKIEALLGVSLRINGKYLFKVTKQHYARLNCQLANQYRKDGKKLYVADHRGFWIWTDYSLSIDETETGNQEDSDRSMDKHIHPFLNSLNRVEGYTPEFVLNSLGELIKDRGYYAENLKAHVGVIKTLGEQVAQVAKAVKRLNNKLAQEKLMKYL